MLRIAGAAVILLTVAEALVLFPLARETPTLLIATLVVANIALSLLVGYFAVNSIALPTARMAATGTLDIVHDTLPILRQGLNAETAAKTAAIVSQLQDVLGVAVHNRQEILATAGEIWNDALEQRVQAMAGQVMQARTPTVRRMRLTNRPTPPLSALITPLGDRRNILGCLTLLTRAEESQTLQQLQRSAQLFAQLLSMQIELGQLDRRAHLAAEAELNTLRAQINPHFLFNTLNTIISYSREDPEMTRRLLVRLADLFRTTMQTSGQIIPFAEEFQHVRNYLFIEQARFRDKLQVVYDIDPQVLKVGIPALSVQPLVENAVRHGTAKKPGGGTVQVTARLDFILMRVVITVRDDGVGIPEAQIPDLLRPQPTSHPGHVGLPNINERLKRLYGEAYSLQIESKPGDGTTVQLRIPMR